MAPSWSCPNLSPRPSVQLGMRGGVLEREELDSSSVVARAREGDVEAFESLYQTHAGRVLTVCQRMAEDPTEAEDWAQEAWIRAWTRLESFRGDARFSTWMHRLTVNLILDRRRRDEKWRKRIVDMDESDRADALGRWDPQVGTRMDLEQAVKSLPDGARTVFLLHEVEGYKQQEIAERLGIRVGTVKSQLHRARRLLQEVLN
jgi:RNA polymerase sigma-70 factor (ECF subfamily)